ncbi:MAG: Rrf2 family transcriptional regulator [Verrucomicrobiales bacterium]
MHSKTAEYALRAVSSLADSKGKSVSASDLAERTMIPRRYLHRVMADLMDADLVESRPGPGGGYALAADIDSVTLLDVINAVSPIPRIRECPLGNPDHVHLCPLHHELDRAYAEVERAFGNVTLGSLVKSNERARVAALCPIVDT